MKKESKNQPSDLASELAEAARAMQTQKYVLRLFVAGISPRSEAAIRNVKEVCEERLKDRYALEIVDIYQHPEALKEKQIVVAPTLIRELPLPLRKLIGDMANEEKLLVGLDLKPAQEKEAG